MTSRIPEPPNGFHPVVLFPTAPHVLDLSLPQRMPSEHLYSIGRYDEQRAIYTQELFEGLRTIHIGIDLGAPAGTPVYAFTDCVIYALGVNGSEGDYGPTIVTQQMVDSTSIWALYGHLSLKSLAEKKPGMAIRKGEQLGWLGHDQENGGWPPHVHFQLSRTAPQGHDMPGVVSPEERMDALERYPDPRWVLGELY